jgi:parallel beta-helix repeat protein
MGFIPILVYVLVRYSPTYYTYIKIPKDKKEILEQAREAHQATFGSIKKKPTGELRYKKGMPTYNGLTIYTDGIYAKWCFGSIGRFKFKTLDEISYIYPVEIESPMVKQDSLLFGRKSWKMLQIESMDYEVLLIDSRVHDFNTLIPLLKELRGSEWEGEYLKHNVIRGKLFESKMGWHSLIREGSEPQTPGQLSEEIPEIYNKSRGSLLAKEPSDIVDKRTRIRRRYGSVLLLPPIIIFAIIFILLLLIDIETFTIIVLSLLCMFGLLLLIPSIMMYRVSLWQNPKIIHENGVLSTNTITQEELFIPYSQFKGVSEGSNPTEGDYYVFEGKNPKFTIHLSKEIPSLKRNIGFIKEQMQNPELDYPVKIPDVGPNLRKLEYLAYAEMIVLSFVLGYLFGYNLFASEGESYVRFGAGIFFPIMTVIMIFFMGILFITAYRRNMSKIKVNLKVIGVIFLAALLIYFYNYHITFNIAWGGDETIGTTGMPESGVSLDVLTSDSNIILNNDLVLEEGQSLTITNAILNFNCKEDNQYKIWVGKGATLIMRECTIKPVDSSYRFGFEIYGTVEISNSTISNVWGDPYRLNWDGGIEIYSDDVRIVNSTIQNGKTNGLLIHKCSPEITGCTISGFEDEGIEMHYSNATITGNTIQDNNWAIGMWPEASPVISGNIVRDNNHGIIVQTRSSPLLLEGGWGLMFFYMCGVFVVLITITLFVILWFASRRPLLELDTYEWESKS